MSDDPLIWLPAVVLIIPANAVCYTCYGLVAITVFVDLNSMHWICTL